MSEEVRKEVLAPPAPGEEERVRIAEKLFKALPGMTSDYKMLIKHTGGMLSASMAFAYSKGLNDALKLILKGDNNEQKK